MTAVPLMMNVRPSAEGERGGRWWAFEVWEQSDQDLQRCGIISLVPNRGGSVQRSGSEEGLQLTK
jgi:hypothetical protein